MNQNEFFKKLMVENNYMDPTTIEEVYCSFVRVIINELRDNGSINLINFGTFRVVDTKPREMYNINSGMVQHLPSRKEVRFRPSPKLKKFMMF
jgi:nucleoid DNA-binding protein